MRRSIRVVLVALLLLVGARPLYAQIGPVDAFTDLHGTTAGTTLSGTILNSGTHGDVSGGWAVTGTGVKAATHITACGLPGSPQVDGTVYPTSNTSLAMSTDNTQTLQIATYSLPSVGFKQGVALACFTPNIGTFGGSGIWDLIRINKNDGTNEIIQYTTSNCGGTAGFDLEVVNGTSAATTCLSSPTGTSVWIMLLSDNIAGTSKMNIYDATGVTLVGSKTLAQGVASDISSIVFGNDQTGTSTGVNTFENMMVRFSGTVPYPLGPVTTTQASVYWIAKSFNNNTAAGTTPATLSTTKALDIPAGATILATISSENASMACTTAGVCFTDSGSNYTFTAPGGNCSVSLAANGAMVVGYVTGAAAHTGVTFTASTNASAFRNIEVVVLSAGSFDVCAKGTTTSGADVTTASFTPVANGTATQFGYITAGVAITPGTGFGLLNTSSTSSFASQLQLSLANSSQTGTMKQANTSSKWSVLMAIKPVSVAPACSPTLSMLGVSQCGDLQ